MITATERVNSEKFAKWLDANRDIWEAFASKADALRSRGRTRYSAYTIMESIRWDTDLRENSDTTFKISNGRIPEVARLYNQTRGVLFFVLKETPAD